MRRRLRIKRCVRIAHCVPLEIPSKRWVLEFGRPQRLLSWSDRDRERKPRLPAEGATIVLRQEGERAVRLARP
jgi:hypothetical protein